MKIGIEPYRWEMVEAVRQFNRRVAFAGGEHSIKLPDTPEPSLLPMMEGSGFGQECFVAMEGPAVRGGYILYRQMWNIDGKTIAVANAMRPISEGVVNPAYGLVGVRLHHDALEREPMMFGLGLGPDGPMTKILKATGWEIWEVPFYFKILNGSRFVRNFQPLRQTRTRALLMDLAARSGLASAGAGFVRMLSSRKPAKGIVVEEIADFSAWADQIWDRSRRSYSALQVRDRDILNRLFAGRDEFVRLKISNGERAAGWAVLDRVSSNRARFGEMNVWAIMDCLAAPEDAPSVMRGAAAYLEGRRVDLVISNQSHPTWQKALRSAGFFQGPSTFLFASAPALTKFLHAADPLRQRMHFTRGGGDVPLPWRARRRSPAQTGRVKGDFPNDSNEISGRGCSNSPLGAVDAQSRVSRY
ncbi:MAG TPA: hypothetical protein VFW83_07680 [Bryobacteraceae bacterium]|nr:hypothetical protein [Bryobacteraceae bacterium]